MPDLSPILPGPRPPEASSKPKKRKRTGQACLACRKRKSRCNGARPACSSCSELEISCEYVSPIEQGVRVKDRYLEALETRLATLETRLTHPSADIPRSNGSVSLGTETSPETSDNSPFRLHDSLDGTSHTGRFRLDSHSASFGVAALPVAHDSFFDEDDSGEQDLGYYGPSSLLSYAHTISTTLKHVLVLGRDLDDDDLGVQADSGGLVALRPAQFSPPHARPFAPAKQHPVDITSLPDYATGLRLIENYFDHIGVLFPFLHRETFLSIYTEFRAGACKIRRVWLATVNMVIALALQRGSEPGRSPDQRFQDSWPYYERATVLYDHHAMKDATLETVQYQLLLTQYLQGTHEAAVTWATHGRAVQSALQIGLHSPQLHQHYDTLESEIRRRTWYTCFILDKTLSMAFGRPPMIHDSFMKPALPVCLAALPGVPGAIVNRSAEYFASTVSMFSTLGNAVEDLYGNNLGYEGEKSIFSLASDVLRIEQQLHEWKTTLPLWLQPEHFEAGTLESNTAEALTKRFQSITVVRYNYMRALIHRPVLARLLLQAAEHQPRDNTPDQLRGIGQRSLESCIDSSIELISCVYAVCKARGQKELLGTWWCSLYFTFTAALNIFAACLLQVEGRGGTEDGLHSPLQLRKSFQQAIRTLEILDEGNSAICKCIVCLKNLDLALAKLHDANHIPHQETLANDISNSLPDSGYAASESLLSLDYADFQEVFDQDLTFLNDMVF